MIVCPRCSVENEDSATNCVNCRVNLQWTPEVAGAVAPGGLRRVQELEAAERPAKHERKGKLRPILHVVLALLLTLAFAVLGLTAVGLFAVAGMEPSFSRAQHNSKGFGLLSITGAIFCISGAIALLRRKRRPVLLVASVLLAVLAVIDGLWFFCW